MKTLSIAKCFAGEQGIYSHESQAVGCTMRFAVFMPPQASASSRVPALLWLSGLTCTEENFVIKAGAQRIAAELGMALIVPDTSPRGLNIPGENDSYDLGTGAGFYLDATAKPWAAHYQMYRYITKEWFELIMQHFAIDRHRIGISGHSMGGHGALTIALKNPTQFCVVSAFAPICAPMRAPWGEKAFSAYLGEDREKWRAYDATELVRSVGWQGPEILIDQGSKDPFLDEQLKPNLLAQACQDANVPINIRTQIGYDHSYFFIASFIEDHLRYHMKHLTSL